MELPTLYLVILRIVKRKVLRLLTQPKHIIPQFLGKAIFLLLLRLQHDPSGCQVNRCHISILFHLESTN